MQIKSDATIITISKSGLVPSHRCRLQEVDLEVLQALGLNTILHQSSIGIVQHLHLEVFHQLALICKR